uniref:alpha-amylase n=1 Tax=Monascus ruber TaxID=89489 RepID=A0A482P4P8_MONRU|nr:alpha-amylase [Monascus ruber]
MALRRISAALALSGFAGCSLAASAEEWASRSIYQIITDRYARPDGTSGTCDPMKYCGGSWKALADNLDYIQDMGFTALQISPINKNLEQNTIYGEAYHGYWPQDLYTLNAHFGTPDDLKNLVSELHKRDMYLMVDVVSNEMAYDIGNNTMSNSTHIDYSVFNPFNSSSDYTPFCPIGDWQDDYQLTNCWLGSEGVATPRMKTTDPAVSQTLTKWIKDLVGTYNVDGIRIDGAKQIETPYMEAFVKSAGVFSMAEVMEGDAKYVCNYQQYSSGLENYPYYYQIIGAFTAGKMDDLVSMVKDVQSTCSSPQYLVNFIENQDNPRFASAGGNLTLAKNAAAFTILADGIPKVYYGQEQFLSGQYSPYNRQDLWSTKYDTDAPLYQLISTLNKLRNHAISLDDRYVTNASTILYHDGSTYATRKGPDGVQIVSVLSNQGLNGGAYKLDIDGAAQEGTNLTDVLSCKTVVAGHNDTITVDMDKGEPHVFFPTYQLNGTGLCGNSKSATSASSSPSGTSTSATATSTKDSAANGLSASFGLMGLGVMGVVGLLL